MLCSTQRWDTEIYLRVLSSDIGNSHSTWRCPGNFQPPHITIREPEHMSHGTAACNQSCYTAYMHQLLHENPFLALHIYSTPKTKTLIHTEHMQSYSNSHLVHLCSSTALCETQHPNIVDASKFTSIQMKTPAKVNNIRWNDKDKIQADPLKLRTLYCRVLSTPKKTTMWVGPCSMG
jgi:hypothetical protein